MLLWHGSRLTNFMGILYQGLKIAPPHSPHSGYMFGKGIYFADTFQKSLAYTDISYTMNNQAPFRMMMLCEVALGKMYELFKSEFITTQGSVTQGTELPPGYLSVKGCGRMGPDMKRSVYLTNGAKVPLGPYIENYKIDELNSTPEEILKNQEIQKKLMLQHNEYIVYNESQVRMRYLVQVAN